MRKKILWEGKKIIGVKTQKVSLEILEYQMYDNLFQIEKKKLMDILDGYYISIEHVGSTSIPGLLAKPIIDIAVGLNNFEDIDIIISMMKSQYIYLENHGETYRKLFIKKSGDFITHHIHIEEYGKQNWINHVVFRDKLLESEAIRNEYMDIKKSLLLKYKEDREKYTMGKAEFIQRVIDTK